jgi:hypothetical protein
MPNTLVLTKRAGLLWYLIVQDTGTTLTGPHRWGNADQAMRAAQAFASSWGFQVVMGEDLVEPIN